MLKSSRSTWTSAMLLWLVAFAARSVHADEPLTEAQARAAVMPFYAALNAGKGDDVASLVKQATSSDWLSCAGNDACRNRDQVIAGIVGLRLAVPDLKWEIRDVLVAGNSVVVRGEARGAPSGEFMSVAYTGKAFKAMSIDIHMIEGGKMLRSYHVEDWMGARRQLTAN